MTREVPALSAPPALALGCARIGSALTPMGRRQCVALLDAAFALGIRHFDTASIYGQGDSERYLGEALSAHRGEVSLESKAGQRLTPKQALISQFKGPIRWLAAQRGTVRQRVADHRAQGVPRCFEPDYIERSLSESLRRLRTDYLDVFYLHSPDPEVLGDERLMRRMQQLRASGRFRRLGVSCDDEATASAAAHHEAVDVVQFAFDRDTGSADLLRALAHHGKAAVLRGFLSAVTPQAGAQAALTRSFGRALGLAGVRSLIVGTTRLEHLRENVAAYRDAMAAVVQSGMAAEEPTR